MIARSHNPITICNIALFTAQSSLELFDLAESRYYFVYALVGISVVIALAIKLGSWNIYVVKAFGQVGVQSPHALHR